ncbi:MAG: ABC transporter ATP-binding protein [Lachnospiraceae bacterium]|nr:ABC transporter ATP-binding protein [Lachnospiraceae bacterium]
MDAVVFENVDCGYGSVRILNDLSFRVTEGEVFGVIGPNGCGKTTMLNALSGFIRPTGGSVFCFDRRMNDLPPFERCRIGIGRTWQIPRPFTGMSVFENVLAAATHGAGKKEDAASYAEEALIQTGLIDRKDALSGELTLLDRKKLELARALATEPKILLLDEVAAGLTETETSEMIRLVGKLRDKRHTIIWIEHNIETMLNATDRLMCMSEGRNVTEGAPADVMASEIVEELYLGTDDE